MILLLETYVRLK